MCGPAKGREREREREEAGERTGYRLEWRETEKKVGVEGANQVWPSSFRVSQYGVKNVIAVGWVWCTMGKS